MSGEIQNNKSANVRIAKNSLFMSIRMILVLGITLYSTRLVLSILGVDDYGVYNAVCGFVGMFAFLNTSMSNGIQRFLNYELGKPEEHGVNIVFNSAILIQLLLAITVLVIAELVGWWYLHKYMVIPESRIIAAEMIFQFSIITFLLIVIQAPFSAAIIAFERMDIYAFICILDAGLTLVIVYTLSYISFDKLILYGVLIMLVKLLILLTYFFVCKHLFPILQINGSHHKIKIRSMLAFSGWNLFGTLSAVLREHGVSLIMNLFYGPVVNAARAIASQINAGLQSFVGNVTVPVRPQVVKSYAQGNIERTMKLTYSISKVSCYFLTMILCPVCLEIDFILKIWLGSNIPDHTSTFAIIVLMCSYQGNLNSAVSTVVHATGKMKKYQLYCSLTKMLSIPFSYIVLTKGSVPEFALLMVFIFDILGHVVALFVLKTIVQFSVMDYLKRVLVPIGIVVTVSFILSYYVHTIIDLDIVRLILVSIVSVISVTIIALAVGLEKSERTIVLQYLSNIKSKIRK